MASGCLHLGAVVCRSPASQALLRRAHGCQTAAETERFPFMVARQAFQMWLLTDIYNSAALFLDKRRTRRKRRPLSRAKKYFRYAVEQIPLLPSGLFFRHPCTDPFTRVYDAGSRPRPRVYVWVYHRGVDGVPQRMGKGILPAAFLLSLLTDLGCLGGVPRQEALSCASARAQARHLIRIAWEGFRRLTTASIYNNSNREKRKKKANGLNPPPVG